jgi:MarR family transcriptional regulator, organic hydroperoxide resistance regulator
LSQEPDFSHLHLDNQICFALYASTRAITKAYRDYLTPMGLTYPQYLVLVVLWEKDGATISEIGRNLHLDSGTLTPLMKRLEADGIVERRRGTRDEREVEVWLTAKGKSLQAGAAKARTNVNCRLGMSDDEIGNLRAQLIQLIARLKDDADSETATTGATTADCRTA